MSGHESAAFPDMAGPWGLAASRLDAMRMTIDNAEDLQKAGEVRYLWGLQSAILLEVDHEHTYVNWSGAR